MKTAIFFDVDNTIYCHKNHKIPEQTKKLLSLLSEQEDVVLGLATGRGLRKLEIINDVLPYFTYKVLLNGAYVLKNDEVIYDLPIDQNDIIDVLKLTKDQDINIGMIGIDDEAVNYMDQSFLDGMKSLRDIRPNINEKFYEQHKVYQLWMFATKEEDIFKAAKLMPNFRVFPWHAGGADFTYPHVNKAYGIKKCLEVDRIDRLICIGDGANDVDMIELADIGIVMDNTRFQELKEKADYIAPHIHEDQLYDFFKKLNLV